MKYSIKQRAALERRIASYEAGNKGGRFPIVSDSPNRNQIHHKPGSQNRKKGYGNG